MDSESPNSPLDPENSAESEEPIVASYAELDQPTADDQRLKDAQVVEALEMVEAEQVEDAQAVVVTELAKDDLAVEKEKLFEEGNPPKDHSVPINNYQLPVQFQNISAKGGAIAAVVLGCLAVSGVFITKWSLFNAVIGIALGLWGLQSNLVRTSMAGIGLCVVSWGLFYALY